MINSLLHFILHFKIFFILMKWIIYNFFFIFLLFYFYSYYYYSKYQ